MCCDFEVRKTQVVTISLEDFVVKASDTMDMFEKHNEPESLEEVFELADAMDNFAKFSAALAHEIFDGD